MNYKKIRGKSYAACLVKLRQAYGDDVKIISIRKVPEGGVFGTKLLAKEIVEIDYMLPERKFSRKAIQESLEKVSERKPRQAIKELSRKLSEMDKAAPEPPLQTKETVLPSPLPASSPEEQAALNRLLEDKDPLPLDKALQEKLSIEPPVFSKAVPSDRKSPGEPPASSVRHFQKIENLLLQSQMSGEYVEDFLSELKQNLSDNDCKDYPRILAKTKELLQTRIRVAPEIHPASGEVKAAIFIGPTGSGKTTALAKIAARYYADYEVSIYSMDHYRLAATAQLKAYAEIMGLEFRAPRSTKELEELIHRDGAELLLFDATGAGYRNQEWLEQIREWVELVRQSVRTERIFCLAANTSSTLLEGMLFSYEIIGIDKILLTKLDESDFIGAFVEYADKFNKPFSYLSDGQVVPNDLHAAEAEELAGRILGRNPALARI